MGNFEMKSFGAFVRQLAASNVRQAVTLKIYVRRATDTIREVRREIENDTNKGLITEERAKELQILVTVLMGWHKVHGQVETPYDSADWVSLGEGAHMRRRHLDENYERPKFKREASTIEEELTKENEDEE